MRIVFMGTPSFAVPSLEALLRSPDEIVGVVTQPDKPKGRGQELAPPPVKLVCEREGLPYLQPAKMKDPAFLDALRAWRADLVAVAAFGRILPPVILQMPPKGCVNVHGSLLPKYRGAAPIQWAVINGETETGITTMLMDEGMDTGHVLLQERVAIGPEETSGELAARLAEVGGRLLVETVRRLKEGTLSPQPQDHAAATMAPPLKKEHGAIDWAKPASAIVDHVRGMSPWPGASTEMGGEQWKIWKVARAGHGSGAHPPGTVLQTGRQGIVVATGDGAIAILELQAPNKRRMAAADFIAGHRIEKGARLGSQPEARTED